MKNPKKIKITARVGKKIGLGHWKRCEALYEEFLQAEHLVFLEPALEKDFQISSISPLGFESSSYDIAILDDPIEPKKYSKGLAPFMVGLDFYEDPGSLFDLVINVFEEKNPEILKSLKIESGIEYMILDRRAQKMIPRSGAAKELLVVLGGLDTKGSTKQILEYLSSMPKVFEKIKLILYSGHEDRKKIEVQISRFKTTQVELLDLQPNLIPLIQECDFMICNGGGVAALSVVQKRPALFCPQSEAEQNFVFKFGAKPEQVLALDELKQAALFNHKLNWVLSERFIPTSALDAYGSKRVVSRILEKYGEKFPD